MDYWWLKWRLEVHSNSLLELQYHQFPFFFQRLNCPTGSNSFSNKFSSRIIYSIPPSVQTLFFQFLKIVPRSLIHLEFEVNCRYTYNHEQEKVSLPVFIGLEIIIRIKKKIYSQLKIGNWNVHILF